MRTIAVATKTITGFINTKYIYKYKYKIPIYKYKYYFSFNDFDDEGRASQFNNNDDPEYFAYECLSVASVEKIFNESIETVRNALSLSYQTAESK